MIKQAQQVAANSNAQVAGSGTDTSEIAAATVLQSASESR